MGRNHTPAVDGAVGRTTYVSEPIGTMDLLYPPRLWRVVTDKGEYRVTSRYAGDAGDVMRARGERVLVTERAEC